MTTAMLPAVVLESMEDFLRMIQSGVGPKNAAIACEWSIKQLRELEAMPQFQQAMAVAMEQRIENVEAKAFELAMAGNVPMIQMILYSHAADRGWRPPAQRHVVAGNVRVEVEAIQTTKGALLQIMQENGAKALAYGGPLDDVVDAEVIEDAEAQPG